MCLHCEGKSAGMGIFAWGNFRFRWKFKEIAGLADESAGAEIKEGKSAGIAALVTSKSNGV